MGGANVNHFMRLKNQLVFAAEAFVRDEKLSLLLIPKISKEMDGHRQNFYKVLDIVNQANRKICVILL